MNLLPPFGEIDFYIFKMAPGAVEMGIHTSPVPWIGYVIKGGGELSFGDDDANEIEMLEYTEGDFLVFEPDTMHGWRNGSKETLLLFLTTLE